MKRKPFVAGKRNPLDFSVQVRNPLAVGHIDIVTSRERSVTQYTTMEEKEDQDMPNFDINKFMGVHKEKLDEKKTKVRRMLDDKKKPVWSKLLKTVSKSALYMLDIFCPRNDDHKDKKYEK